MVENLNLLIWVWKIIIKRVNTLNSSTLLVIVPSPVLTAGVSYDRITKGALPLGNVNIFSIRFSLFFVSYSFVTSLFFILFFPVVCKCICV